jgi:hypothetical protein
MNYQELIQEEVYSGKPNDEHFYVIEKVTLSPFTVTIVMEDFNKHKSITLSKEQVDKFVKDEYIEYAGEVLMTCGKAYEILND